MLPGARVLGSSRVDYGEEPNNSFSLTNRERDPVQQRIALDLEVQPVGGGGRLGD
jgi:hypothetical protein